MVDDENDIIIAATCLFSPKISAISSTLVLFPLLLPPDSDSKVLARCERRKDAVKTCKHVPDAAILLRKQ